MDKQVDGIVGYNFSFFLLFIQPVILGFYIFLLKNIGHKKLNELNILQVNEEDFFLLFFF